MRPSGELWEPSGGSSWDFTDFLPGLGSSMSAYSMLPGSFLLLMIYAMIFCHLGH